MYGVTQSESFHLLNAATLQFGLTETERNRIIRTYVRNSYNSNIDQITAAILNEYTVIPRTYYSKTELDLRDRVQSNSACH